MSFVHDRTESFIHYYTNQTSFVHDFLTFDNITTWKLKEQGWTLLKHYWHSGVHRLASWIPRLWTRGPGARHKPRKLSLSSSHQDPAEIKNELHLELKAVESEHKLRMRIFGILHNPCWPQNCTHQNCRRCTFKCLKTLAHTWFGTKLQKQIREIIAHSEFPRQSTGIWVYFKVSISHK